MLVWGGGVGGGGGVLCVFRGGGGVVQYCLTFRVSLWEWEPVDSQIEWMQHVIERQLVWFFWLSPLLLLCDQIAHEAKSLAESKIDSIDG